MAFLDRERLTNYPRIFLGLYVGIGGWWLLGGPGLLDRSGKVIGVDFITFYAVSRLTLDGAPEAAWNLDRITHVERAVIGAEIPSYVFHYPPTFVLMLLPLGLLGYLGALVAWWVASTAAFVAAARAMAPRPVTLGLALAFPGFFQNIVQGQNGAFTAALLGGGLALVDSRPLTAGLLLGALSYKPHLAPVVGVALLFGRRWRALGAAVATALTMIIVSVVAFGLEPWWAFIANVPFAVRVLETEGVLPWFRMPTVQVAAMLLGAPVYGARLAQGISTVAALGLVAWAWARGGALATRATVVACAAVLATPFAFDYDLAILAIPVAFLAIARQAAPWSGARGELPLLVAAWAGPLWIPAVAQATHVGLAPVLLLLLILASLRRFKDG